MKFNFACFYLLKHQSVCRACIVVDRNKYALFILLFVISFPIPLLPRKTTYLLYLLKKKLLQVVLYSYFDKANHIYLYIECLEGKHKITHSILSNCRKK